MYSSTIAHFYFCEIILSQRSNGTGFVDVAIYQYGGVFVLKEMVSIFAVQRV
jgi:hypothetical protein